MSHSSQTRLLLAQSRPSIHAGSSEGLALADAIARDLGTAVIVTMGGAGSAVATPTSNGRSIVSTVPAEVVDAVDTTGAGDTFVGALAARLADQHGPIGHQRIAEAMRMAARAAATACTRVGAQTAMPTRNELRSTPD